VKTHIN